MPRIAADYSLPSRETLRLLAQNALQKNLYLSASLIVEKLISIGSITEGPLLDSMYVEDCVLYARCFFLSGEPRRCLAVLEQKQLLSANLISYLADIVNPQNGKNENYDVKFLQNVSLHLEAIQLAAQCLFSIEQYDDCSILLEPLIYIENDESWTKSILDRLKKYFSFNSGASINQMSSIYCIYGRCSDVLDNRTRSLRSLTNAILIDIACTEAAEHIVNSGMLSLTERRSLFTAIHSSSSQISSHRRWLLPFYEYLLLDQDPAYVDLAISDSSESGCRMDNQLIISRPLNNASWLVRQAEYNFDHQFVEDAYRLARHAYTIDPFDYRGLVIYIASMVELKLKTELFYLGHELVNSYPKLALSWYCVGCYYWCCLKHEFAQKYILKTTKMDKKFAKAWVMLGHVLAAQEESEQAISSYRTAIRLLPGDHRPMVYMAKEMLRTNFLSLALHVLLGALELCPRDPGVLNELGVVYMKLGNLGEAVGHFQLAVRALDSDDSTRSDRTDNFASSMDTGSLRREKAKEMKSRMFSFRKSCGFEIYNNYATALRKLGRFEDALKWYEKCSAANPRDASIYASKGFTLHLMQRFDEAIYCYHQALALQPKLAICAEMVNRAMEDSIHYGSAVEQGRAEPHILSFSAAIAEPQKGDESLVEHSFEEMFSPNSEGSCSPSMSRLAGRLSNGSLSSDGGDFH